MVVVRESDIASNSCNVVLGRWNINVTNNYVCFVKSGWSLWLNLNNPNLQLSETLDSHNEVQSCDLGDMVSLGESKINNIGASRTNVCPWQTFDGSLIAVDDQIPRSDNQNQLWRLSGGALIYVKFRDCIVTKYPSPHPKLSKMINCWLPPVLVFYSPS